MAELLLSPSQADCVRRILWIHLPSGARVSVFGSRATGRGLKPHSDLDLLIDSPVELPLMAMADVREALAESNLPFSVDLLDRSDASADVQEEAAGADVQTDAQDATETQPVGAEESGAEESEESASSTAPQDAEPAEPEEPASEEKE